MREQRKIGDVEAAFIHLRLCRDMITADYAMRRAEYGAIPCPLCRYGGTIYYQISENKPIAAFDTGRWSSSVEHAPAKS